MLAKLNQEEPMLPVFLVHELTGVTKANATSQRETTR